MKKKLVILTTHFGTNFSGGSTATCEIFSRLENQFQEIIVVGTDLGDHPFESLTFIKYRNWIDAIKIIRSLNQDAVFYGDFYNSILFILAGVPFTFTYHDNWPELGRHGFSNFLRSVFYVNTYKYIFKKADRTITVSKFKLNYIKKYTSNATLVYNGFNANHTLDTNVFSNTKKDIMMVGNIDKRKYGLALKLFENWHLASDVNVDIYGNITDQKLADKLEQFPFVNLKGFTQNIPYLSYGLLLHTSVMENLPIVFCEAIHNKIPVLAFDVGGSCEIVTKENGVLIPPYNLELMKNYLQPIMGQFKVKDANNKSLKQHCWDLASTRYMPFLLN